MNKQLAWMALAIVSGGLAGFVVSSISGNPSRASGSALQVPGVPEPGTAAHDSAAGQDLGHRVATLSLTVESLSSLLEQEIEERRWLEDELYALREELDQTSRAGNSPPQAATAQTLPRRRFSDVNVEAFINAGFDPVLAENLKKRTDGAVLERLYLRDEAAREGWLNTSKYFEKLRNLPNNETALRRELGESDYDRYLFALGRPNRVTIDSVMEGSAAQKAGIQEGDVLYSYGGERLYSRRALSPFTRSGEAGELVPVEVMRDGSRMQVYIPRGPLGVALNSASIRP